MSNETEELKAQVAKLKAALRPFAECAAQRLSPHIPADQQILWVEGSTFSKATGGISYQDIENAREALSE